MLQPEDNSIEQAIECDLSQRGLWAKIAGIGLVATLSAVFIPDAPHRYNVVYATPVNHKNYDLNKDGIATFESRDGELILLSSSFPLRYSLVDISTSFIVS